MSWTSIWNTRVQKIQVNNVIGNDKIDAINVFPTICTYTGDPTRNSHGHHNQS